MSLHEMGLIVSRIKRVVKSVPVSLLIPAWLHHEPHATPYPPSFQVLIHFLFPGVVGAMYFGVFFCHEVFVLMYSPLLFLVETMIISIVGEG